MGWNGGWGIRRRDLGPGKGDVEMVKEGEKNMSVNIEDRTSNEKVTDEMAGEPIKGSRD